MELNMEEINRVFWTESFWLPPNVTWSELNPETTSTPSVKFCNFYDLGYPLLMCWLILAARFVLERRVFRAIGISAGLNGKRSMPTKNDVLEAQFQSGKRVSSAEMTRLAKKVDMSEGQVENWLKQRFNASKSSKKLDKFCEQAYKSLYHTWTFVYSWIVLWDKKWFWTIKACWHDFPYHSVPDDIWWYYMIQLSAFWSLIITQFASYNSKRKDFKAMFIHHIMTILLISISWTTNFFRVGTLVLWVHDQADVWIDAAKMFKYIGKDAIADPLFYTFGAMWVITRLGVFPTWILYSVTAEGPNFVPYFPAYHIFGILLSALVVLHVFWAYFIFKTAYMAYYTPGAIKSDSRSDTEESD